MIKVTIAVLSVLTFVGQSEARFRDDKCGKAEIWFDRYYGRIQCDYTDRASEHYKFENGVHYTWAYTNDERHSVGAKGVNPRTEITLGDKHAYTRRDVAEFSG